MCMKSGDCKLQERVNSIDKRVTRLEENMATGFTTVTAAVNQLATDLNLRMNTLDQRIVEEKAKWGECFRSWLGWIVRLLILGCGAAMGMTAWKIICGDQ